MNNYNICILKLLLYGNFFWGDQRRAYFYIVPSRALVQILALPAQVHPPSVRSQGPETWQNLDYNHSNAMYLLQFVLLRALGQLSSRPKQWPDPCVCFRNQPGKIHISHSAHQVVTFHRLRCRYLRRAFFLPNPSQIRNPLAREACRFDYSSILVHFLFFLYRPLHISTHPNFLSALDFDIDVRFNFLQGFTPVSPGQLARYHRIDHAGPPHYFCTSPSNIELPLLLFSHPIIFTIDVRLAFLQKLDRDRPR